MALKLSQLTIIAWTVLPHLDGGIPCPFSLQVLEDAIAKENVIDLLKQLDDENGLIETSIRLDREEINTALTNAGSALSGRWARKTGIENNVHCHVIAMVLEAVQQNFRD